MTTVTGQVCLKNLYKKILFFQEIRGTVTDMKLRLSVSIRSWLISESIWLEYFLGGKEAESTYSPFCRCCLKHVQRDVITWVLWRPNPEQQPVGACKEELVWPDDHHFFNNYKNKYLDMVNNGKLSFNYSPLCTYVTFNS